MTLAKLVEICKESGHPASPLAVTRLELNCQLFSRIGECVADYRDVQQLHLDRNRISRIENLSSLQHLRCLYLQGNAIRSIEGLEGLVQLRLLNLSGNAISRLSGLDRLPRLEALLVSDNLLADGPSIQHLAGCTAVCELDLGHNQLGDAEAVLQVLAAMPGLQTLTLANNPLAAGVTPAAAPAAGPEAHPPHHPTAAPHVGVAVAGGPPPAVTPPLAFYRRTVVARCPQLTALDHRAVFPQERRYAEAWWQGMQQEQQPRHQYRRPEGQSAAAATAAAEGSAVGPPDGAKLPTDVLYPVLARLDARTLVMAALTCRPWAGAAAFPLAQQRLIRAKAALCDAAAAVPRLAAAITDVRRDELDELLASGPPARPLVQLFFSLEVLWRGYRRKLERRQAAQAGPEQRKEQRDGGAGCVARQGHVDRIGTDRAGDSAVERPGAGREPRRSATGGDVEEGEVGEAEGMAVAAAVAGPSASSGHGPGPGTVALSRRGSPLGLGRGVDSLDAGLQPSEDPELNPRPGSQSDEDEAEISDLDPEPLDLDSQTWRMAIWEAALEMLRAADAFPLPSLLEALPLGPRGLAALRCRTGSADELDFYVPQLRPEDVARHNASAGRLAEWLLGVEAHCRAAHEADAAIAWTWPAHVTQSYAAAAAGDTGNAEAAGAGAGAAVRGDGNEDEIGLGAIVGADPAAPIAETSGDAGRGDTAGDSGGGGSPDATAAASNGHCADPCTALATVHSGDSGGERVGIAVAPVAAAAAAAAAGAAATRCGGAEGGWVPRAAPEAGGAACSTAVADCGALHGAGRRSGAARPSAADAAWQMRKCVEGILAGRRAAARLAAASAVAEPQARAQAAAAAAVAAAAITAEAEAEAAGGARGRPEGRPADEVPAAAGGAVGREGEAAMLPRSGRREESALGQQ